MSEQLKTCSTCGTAKPASPEYFHRDKSRRDGLFHACRDCERKRRNPTPPKPTPRAGYKVCSVCGEEQPATPEFFTRNKQGQDGLRSMCKECQQKKNRGWHANNKAKSAEQGKLYRLKNKDQIKKRMAAYYLENRNRYAENSRKWYAANHERQLEIGRQWSRRNPEKRRQKHNAYRAKKRAAEGTYTAADVQAQYERQKGKCYYCHKKVGDAYHVDHVVPLSRGGSNWPENIVIACPTCNQRKREKLPHEWVEGGRLL